MYQNNLYIIITPKYIKKKEKKDITEKKGCGCGVRTRDPWVGSPATYPLSHPTPEKVGSILAL